MADKNLLDNEEKNSGTPVETQARESLSSEVWNTSSQAKPSESVENKSASAAPLNLPEILIDSTLLNPSRIPLGLAAVTKTLMNDGADQINKGASQLLDKFALAAKVIEKYTRLPDPRDKFDHTDKTKGKPGDASKPRAIETQEMSWRGKDISLTTRDGMPVAYKDADGRSWSSEDGNGWMRDGDGYFAKQSKISLDKEAKQIREENPYGLTTTYKEDGSVTQSFKARDGVDVSLTKNEDGTQKLVDGGKTWDSRDGKTWTSGSETKNAEIRIDDHGRLITKANDKNEVCERESSELSSVKERMASLSKRYNVQFGAPPEQIPYENSEPNTPQLDLRYPTTEELTVLEENLKKYSHVARKGGSNFEGLKFNWVASTETAAANATEHGWHDGGKTPAISIAPRDTAKTRGWDGYEGTIVHELAHQLQEVRWKNAAGHDDIPKAIPKFFGFEEAADTDEDDPKVVTKSGDADATNLEKTGDTAAKAKEEDDDGGDEEAVFNIIDRDGKRWQSAEIKVDGDVKDLWMPVGEDGKPSKDPSVGLTNSEMRARIPEERRPATDYFPHPQEAHAEAIAMFLFDSKRLYNENVRLYAATKKWDQSDINYRYGFKTDSHGWNVPKMIRGIDGGIIPNTAENRKAIREAEEKWKLEPKDKHASLPHVGRRCSCHS